MRDEVKCGGGWESRCEVRGSLGRTLVEITFIFLMIINKGGSPSNNVYWYFDRHWKIIHALNDYEIEM